MNGKICPHCKNPINIVLGKNPSDCVEGDVYSEDGIRELYITGLCEYCFDKATTIEDPEDLEDEDLENQEEIPIYSGHVTI